MAKQTWKDKVVKAAGGTQTGAIVRRALGMTGEEMPRYVGNGMRTSDGFVMCDFIARDGRYHMGAFVGAYSDCIRNTNRLAEHCKLNPKQTEALVAAVQTWAGER